MEWFSKTSIAGVQIPNWGGRSRCRRRNLTPLLIHALSRCGFKSGHCGRKQASTRTTESAMPSPREIEQLKELIGEYNEEISRLWQRLSPVERGWVELPDEEVADLRRRMSQCESELERLKQELSEALRKDQAAD